MISLCKLQPLYYVPSITFSKCICIYSSDAVSQTEADFTSHVLSTGTLSIGVDATTWNTYTSGMLLYMYIYIWL